MSDYVPDDGAIEAMFAEVAAKMAAIDATIRAQWAGKPARDIEGPAAEAFATAGVSLGGSVQRYAQAVSACQDFEFIVH